jgi:phage shock protein PspC (stress-responsive transcriptional regulator)
MPNARLTRSDTDRLLAGVCGGIAAYLGLDSVLVRIAFLILAFASGIGLPIYLILWIIMPIEEDLGKPGSIVVQDNIEDLGNTMVSGVNRFGKPGTVGVVLVLLGGYFLLAELGIAGGVFWPIVIIGAGIFWLVRSNR